MEQYYLKIKTKNLVYSLIRIIFMKEALLKMIMQRYCHMEMECFWISMGSIKGSLRMDKYKEKASIINLLLISNYNSHHYYLTIILILKHFLI